MDAGRKYVAVGRVAAARTRPDASRDAAGAARTQTFITPGSVNAFYRLGIEPACECEEEERVRWVGDVDGLN